MKYYPLILLILITGCTSPVKKVMFINSYHPGYPPSDEITQAVINHFPKDSFELVIEYLDAKRNPIRANSQEKIDEISEKLNKFAPDILIVSDDNAVQTIVVPLKGSSLPIIFCGVNWSCQDYGLPAQNVTGMLEVLPVDSLLFITKQHVPTAKRLTVLSENSLSEESNKKWLNPLFNQLGFETSYKLVDTFEEWKQAFIKANSESDILYLPTNGGIKDWHNEEAAKFVAQHISIPVITCDDFMMQFCVFGMTKVAYEQGEWASVKAKEVLKGKPITHIEVSKNNQWKYWINSALARKISFQPKELPNINYIN